MIKFERDSYEPIKYDTSEYKIYVGKLTKTPKFGNYILRFKKNSKGKLNPTVEKIIESDSNTDTLTVSEHINEPNNHKLSYLSSRTLKPATITGEVYRVARKGVGALKTGVGKLTTGIKTLATGNKGGKTKRNKTRKTKKTRKHKKSRR